VGITINRDKISNGRDGGSPESKFWELPFLHGVQQKKNIEDHPDAGLQDPGLSSQQGIIFQQGFQSAVFLRPFYSGSNRRKSVPGCRMIFLEVIYQLNIVQRFNASKYETQ
jgi:hypothetical protein